MQASSAHLVRSSNTLEVVLVTLDQEQADTTCKRLGANDYFVHPFELDTLCPLTNLVVFDYNDEDCDTMSDNSDIETDAHTESKGLRKPQSVDPSLLTFMDLPKDSTVSVMEATNFVNDYSKRLKLRDGMQVTLDTALATLIHKEVGETISYFDLVREMKPLFHK